jgi:GNAT superfamily N-acetyltransferase
VDPPPPDPTPNLRKATVGDVPRLAHALARAFYDDPVFKWLVPNDAERIRRSARGFAFYLCKVYLPHEECYMTADGTGGAMWVPPDKWRLSPFAQLRLAPGMVVALGRRLPQTLRAVNTIESKHPHQAHYYLAFVGLEPELQGKGIGTALLRPILDRCDRDRIPAYLEASAPRNRAYYLRHGFEVTEEYHYPKNGPPSWRMWREPQS